MPTVAHKGANLTLNAERVSGAGGQLELKFQTAPKPGTGSGSAGGSTGGGSSSSGGGGGGSSSSSKPSTSTGTTTRPDGTKVQTETKADGTKIQTTTNKDGSTVKTTTNPNGSSVTENKAANGSTGTVKTDKNGQTTAETALSSKAIEDAKKSGEPVTAPVEVEATRDSSTAPTVKIELPRNSGDTKVEIPVSNVKPGTVAVLVHPDGTEEIVKNSLPTADGIQLTVNGGATVKIVDNSKDFIDTRNHWAKDAIDFVSAREMCIRDSVTSALPSIMNGGKDFSEWSKKDDLLYKTLRLPVETVLGRDGVGLADCAIAESKFEKGENISGRMLTIISRMSDLRNNGTPDMEFAVSGLLARSQLAGGRGEDARRTVLALREQFEGRGLTRFFPNMDAMLCRIDLHTGQLDRADEWYRAKAPRDPIHLNVMKRYQYFTQAMVEIADGQPDAALMTLSPLGPYIKTCGRYIDGIHLNVLTAIALYRKKDERWRERLTVALDAAAEYRFIRTVSVYGTAVLPLLEALDWDGDKKWYKQIMAAVRKQAAFYPHFLEPRLAPGEELTPTELQILHLLCADKSNAEIAQIMDVKLPTVKTHVSHILDKLNVKRRAEAKTAAKKLRLIPDDL